MRFTDGLWLKRAGVDFRGGVEVAEILNKDEKTGIDYLVACRHIANRGDSMDGESESSQPHLHLKWAWLLIVLVRSGIDRTPLDVQRLEPG